MNCPHCGIRVSEHEANRCLDAWVAEAVMGKPTRHNAEHWMGWHWTTKDGMRVRWYSTDIRAAWEMLCALQSKARIIRVSNGDGDSCDVNILADALSNGQSAHSKIKDGTLENAPLAICRAALKAV